MKIRLIKTDNGEIVILNPSKVSKQLKDLPAGFYIQEIYPEDNRLVKMKKFYFSMESALANHIGCTKTELHNDIKKHTKLGRVINPETGKEEYESIAKIKDCTTMLTRIFEFQKWASDIHNYKTEPYNDNEPNENTTSRLCIDI